MLLAAASNTLCGGDCTGGGGGAGTGAGAGADVDSAVVTGIPSMSMFITE